VTLDLLDPDVSLDALIDPDEARGILRPLADLTRASLSLIRPDGSHFLTEPHAIAPRAPAPNPLGERALSLHGRPLGAVTIAAPIAPDPARTHPKADRPAHDAALACAAASIEAIARGRHALEAVSAVHSATHRGPADELDRKIRELEQVNARLREADRVKDSFLATISHELKTPLTSILGYAELLEERIGGPLSDEQLGFVGVISEKARQLLQMIVSVIELARLEPALLRARAAEGTSLDELAREVVRTFAPAAMKRGVHVELDLSPDAPRARGDRDALRQVLQNLVDNALKFSRAPGLVRISVRPARGLIVTPPDDDGVGLALFGDERPSVELRVSDTGIGVAQPERERVFDPFVQLHTGAARPYGGAGLGLALVRRICEGLGGSARLEDNPDGRGITAVVTLPIVEPEPETPA
jgi:two-component system sensor histidine kinase BarA